MREGGGILRGENLIPVLHDEDQDDCGRLFGYE